MSQAHGMSRYSDLAALDEPALKTVLAHFIQCQVSSRTPAFVGVGVGRSGIEGLMVATCRPIYEVLDKRCVTDLIWFVVPGAHGATAIRLLRAMHKWADTLADVAVIRQQTSDAICDHATTDRILAASGMHQVGTVYERELTP